MHACMHACSVPDFQGLWMNRLGIVAIHEDGFHQVPHTPEELPPAAGPPRARDRLREEAV